MPHSTNCRRKASSLAEILLLHGLIFSHEAVRDWETKPAPLLTDTPARCVASSPHSVQLVFVGLTMRCATFLRPAIRRGQHVPASKRRVIHVQRVAALRNMLAIA